jgi:hypothetical protein
MRFLTDQESRDWLKSGEPARLDDRGSPCNKPAAFHTLQFVYRNEAAPRLCWLSQRIVAALDYWDWCLLWVTLTGIWPSSENLHLYYRLRQSYGDQRHLEVAPGHLALRHEQEDMITLLQVCMMNGWDAHLFTSHDYARAYVSHDEYGEISVTKHVKLDSVHKTLVEGKIKVKMLDSAV